MKALLPCPVDRCLAHMIYIQAEMQQWWKTHQREFPGLLTPEQVSIVEDRTGRLPILLMTFLWIDSGGISNDIGDEQHTPDDEVFDIPICNLWTSPEATAIVVGVEKFAREHNEKYRDSRLLLVYVSPSCFLNANSQ